MSPFTKILVDIVYNGLERFGRYYSKYRAFVVDNEDPNGTGRLRLMIPGISDNPSDYWAWGVGQFSGEGYGCQVLPPKGAVVWVEFEKGDPNRPIWNHGHFALKYNTPKELTNPNIFWFKTPNGHIITLDDETGEIGITNTNGDTITSTDKGISQKTKGKVYLGDKEKGDEVAAMGNATEKVMLAQVKGMTSLGKGLLSNIKSTSDMFTKMIAAATPIGAAGVIISEGPKMIKSLADQTKLTTELNESFNAITKDIPKIKSSKVVIEK